MSEVKPNVTIGRRTVAILNRITSKAHAGVEKYGHNMDRRDLTLADWAHHAQDEAIDWVQYLEAVRENGEAVEAAAHIFLALLRDPSLSAGSKNSIRAWFETHQGVLHPSSMPLDLEVLDAELTEEQQTLAAWKLLCILRENEGASVTITCDNPEPGPRCQVLVADWWTGWTDRSFRADTILEALQAAQSAQVEAAKQDLTA